MPSALDILDLGLDSELPFRTDLACDSGDFRGENSKLVNHIIDRVDQVEDLSGHLDANDLLREVSTSDRGLVSALQANEKTTYRGMRNCPHLLSQVGSHDVHTIRQILPGSCDARHSRLTAKSAVRSDLSRDTRNLGRETSKRLHHVIDSVLGVSSDSLKTANLFTFSCRISPKAATLIFLLRSPAATAVVLVLAPSHKHVTGTHTSATLRTWVVRFKA